jgi:hypothetical protein
VHKKVISNTINFPGFKTLSGSVIRQDKSCQSNNGGKARSVLIAAGVRGANLEAATTTAVRRTPISGEAWHPSAASAGLGRSESLGIVLVQADGKDGVKSRLRQCKRNDRRSSEHRFPPGRSASTASACPRLLVPSLCCNSCPLPPSP